MHGKSAAGPEAPAEDGAGLQTGQEAGHEAGSEPVVLIKSQRVEKRQLDNTISVYGDVVAGKPVADQFSASGAGRADAPW